MRFGRMSQRAEFPRVSLHGDHNFCTICLFVSELANVNVSLFGSPLGLRSLD